MTSGPKTMHTHSVAPWAHEHVFLGEAHGANERRTWLVVGLTLFMMVVEIGGGSLFGSMAVVADGWHMSTHAAALAIAALAYRFASRHARDARFSFGTGKLGELAAFASAVILAVVALLIGAESLGRLFAPVAIRFDEAIAIAVAGLLVNLASAWLLSGGHAHGRHAHGVDKDHTPGDASAAQHGHDHDTNLRAAFVHVVADALTSVLAIAALLGGRYWGWMWLDPLIGVAGALVILSWSLGLIRAAGSVLLDIVPDASLADAIRGRLEVGGDRVCDLHLWRVGPGHCALVVSVVSDAPRPPRAYKARLEGLGGLSHVTVEVEPCPHHRPSGAAA